MVTADSHLQRYGGAGKSPNFHQNGRTSANLIRRQSAGIHPFQGSLCHPGGGIIPGLATGSRTSHTQPIRLQVLLESAKFVPNQRWQFHETITGFKKNQFRIRFLIIYGRLQPLLR